MSTTNTTTAAPGAAILSTTAPGIDHAADYSALALSIFAGPIVMKGQAPIGALHDWVRMLEGIGGYLSCTAVAFDGDRPPLAGHLEAVGDLIERAAQIAACLAEQAESDLLRAARREGAA